MFLIRWVAAVFSARTWLAFTHHVTGLIVAIVAFTFTVTLLFFGVGTLPLALVGLVVLGFLLRFGDGLARFERGRFALLLDRQIPAWPAAERPEFRWLLVPRRSAWGKRATWGQLGYAILRLPVSLLTSVSTVAFWAVGLVMVTLPAYASALPGGGPSFGDTHLHGPKPLLISFIGGVLVLLAAPQLTRGWARMDGALANWLLAPPRDVLLAARVSQLEESRERVVDAAEAERRRIERDLHDGAQQRLVALAMELGRAKAKFSDDVDAAAALVDQAHAEAKAALVELRDLVRGVHPPVLTDRGLDAALSGLIARCPVPVDLKVEVPVRPKATVEAVAYFVVAESLTNIAKHSRASHASVVVEGHGFPGTLNLVISDDGIGGADANGAGLSGLADRVAGVDGTLSVESPSGGPTIISAVLPCG
jgi:signal transduction histidine kinase